MQKPRGPAKLLTSRKAISAYLKATIEGDDPAIVVAVLKDIARAHAFRPDAGPQSDERRIQRRK